MTKREKTKIANCLVRAIKTKEAVNKETHSFLANWIYSEEDERGKEWLEVWEMVLNQYMPEGAPVLFRATDYINDGKIESYTERMYVAERFLKCCGEEGKLLVCDTENYYGVRFYPLTQLLRNELEIEDSLFNKGFMVQYIGEDEYIMRTNIECCSIYKKIS